MSAATTLRNIVRHALPRRARQRLVAPLRRLVEGPGIETYVLRPMRFAPDTETRPRLTLVLPGLNRREAFGGVMTGLDLFLALGAALREAGPLDLRILTEEPYDAADSPLTGRAGAEGVTVQSLAGGAPAATRAGELFLVYNWWIALNIEPLLAAQAAHFDQAPLPKYYLIQEYEPHFYPFSSAHLLARQAFNAAWPTHAIFNSTELHAYFRAQGDRCAAAHVFEPRLPGALHGRQDGIGAGEKSRTILVYGRPQIPRNCFSIVEMGLKLWAAQDPQAKRWRLVSAGLKHPDLDLGAGVRLASLGKLSLDAYAALLRETAVGISLMSSPHPSYPPLEMAHFGARVLTNSYACKDLTARHDNIVSLPDPLPGTLGATLTRICAEFEADPGRGLAGRSHMPDYLSRTPFDCLEAVSAEMAGFLGR